MIASPRAARLFSTKARIAVVGVGGWAQGWHLPNLDHHPDVEIAAMVDGNASPSSTFIPGMEALATLSHQYGGGRPGGVPLYASVDEMLADKAVADNVDGIICSTNHASHYSKDNIALCASALSNPTLLESPPSHDALAVTLYHARRRALVPERVRDLHPRSPPPLHTRSSSLAPPFSPSTRRYPPPPHPSHLAPRSPAFPRVPPRSPAFPRHWRQGARGWTPRPHGKASDDRRG